jgi:hypothetical protein
MLVGIVLFVVSLGIYLSEISPSESLAARKARERQETRLQAERLAEERRAALQRAIDDLRDYDSRCREFSA